MGARNNGTNSGLIAENVVGDINIYNGIESKKRLSSLLPKFIEILATDLIITESQNNEALLKEYRIEDKIKHNNLVRYKSIADEYGNYYSICKNSFDSLSNLFSYSEKRILWSVEEKYKNKKRSLLQKYYDENGEHCIEQLELIRENADYIIDMVGNSIKEDIMINYSEEKIEIEDINFCLPVFLCYCFIECKILERP